MILSWTKKFLVLLAFFCILSMGVNLLWFYTSRDFTPRHFKPPVEFKGKNTLTSLPDNTFTYLGHGKQSIVFESTDHKTVLKLFYWKRPLRKKWYKHAENWMRFASPSWLYKTLIKKKQIKALFERYDIAANELKQETGVIGAHLAKTSAPILITLIDRGGKARRIDLSKVPFVLQKKATLVPEYLNQKLVSGDIEGAKHALEELKKILFSRIEKGYLDTRQVYKRNFGFIDDQPVQIDIGKIEKRITINYEMEKQKVEVSLSKYVAKHYPSIGKL